MNPLILGKKALFILKVVNKHTGLEVTRKSNKHTFRHKEITELKFYGSVKKYLFLGGQSQLFNSMKSKLGKKRNIRAIEAVEEDLKS